MLRDGIYDRLGLVVPDREERETLVRVDDHEDACQPPAEATATVVQEQRPHERALGDFPFRRRLRL
jgi:hypothetical protein